MTAELQYRLTLYISPS